MDVIADRLSRVAALRPHSRIPDLLPGTGVLSNSEKLVQLIEGESRINRLGGHIRRQLLEFGDSEFLEFVGSGRGQQILKANGYQPLKVAGTHH